MIGPQPDPLIGFGMAMAIVVATVFAAAGFLKARSPSTTAVELDGLGVPLPRLLARLLPLIDLTIAGSLIVIPRAGSLMALAALAVFTVVLLRAVRSGAPVSCGCLGSFSDTPVTYATVARNALLAVMAATALAVPEPLVPDLASALSAVAVVVVALIAAQLVTLRSRIGRVWSVTLAGEQTNLSPRGGK
jgi:hypothetical protein